MGFENILKDHGVASVGMDPESAALGGLLLVWVDTFMEPKTATDVLVEAETHSGLKKAILEFCPAKGGDLPRSQPFSRKLNKYRARQWEA
jgi:hypothetical protein